jgi:ribosomal-protein-alanine N-acetyltransferase
MTYAIEQYCLRALGLDDAEALHHYEKVNRDFLRPWEPERDEDYFTLSNARARVEQQREHMDAGRSVCFVLVDPGNEEILGRCNYSNIIAGAFQACYLGFSLAQAVQGQGLMKRSLEAGNRHCFEQIGLHRIMANHLPRNVRSERLLASLGFEKEGYARGYLKIAGVWEDHVLRALTNPLDSRG